MSAVSISNDPGQSHKIMSEVFLTRLLATKVLYMSLKCYFSICIDGSVSSGM